MIATILSFAISLVLLAGLLGYKIIRARQGEILVEEHHDIYSFIPHHVNFGSIKKIVIKYSQKYAHIAILIALRGWIKSVIFLKREAEIVTAKIKSWLPKKHKEQSVKVVSNFLQSISDYKTKLKKISDEIKAEEEKNF